MKIIISPAKKMRSDLEDRHDLTQPVYLKKTARLLDYLKTLSRHELRQLLACNAALADLNYERYQSMNLEQKTSAALYSYEGIQYQYMAPQYLENHIDSYLQTHLRILSGFYGILKPFDGIVPYRLEMQAKLQTDFCCDLYDFWQDDLYREIAGGVILNLASKEYSRAIKKIYSINRSLDRCHICRKSREPLERERRLCENGTW